MTSEERWARVRKLLDGLDPREIRELMAGVQADIAEEGRRRDFVAALLAERSGYERQGDESRVRQVDEQLANYGYVAEGAAAA